MVTRNRLLIALCVVAAALAWNAISVQEVVTLRVLAGEGTEDHFARVWVVEAKPYLWIRAEEPTRNWLEPLRENPDIYIWRGGERYAYHAEFWENDDTRAHVDAMFLEKYGWVEKVRALRRHGPTTPIRLDPLRGDAR